MDFQSLVPQLTNEQLDPANEAWGWYNDYHNQLMSSKFSEHTENLIFRLRRRELKEFLKETEHLLKELSTPSVVETKSYCLQWPPTAFENDH
jgi:hypothetical protein